jgi:hypothetical protein
MRRLCNFSAHDFLEGVDTGAIFIEGVHEMPRGVSFRVTSSTTVTDILNWGLNV